MPVAATAATLYLLLVPVMGQGTTATSRMNQLSPAMPLADCQARIAHMSLPNIGCYAAGSDEAKRVESDITPRRHMTRAPVGFGK